MMALFDTVRTLTRNWTSFRGHTPEEGIFNQGLRLISRSGNDYLRNWLQRKNNWTSGESQNEMIKIVYSEVMKKILNKIYHSEDLFVIMIDETTNISNVQQTSYFLRYVDSNFLPIEFFLGLVETAASECDFLYTQIKNTLIALWNGLINCSAQGMAVHLTCKAGFMELKLVCSMIIPRHYIHTVGDIIYIWSVKMDVSTFQCRTPLP